MTQETPAAKPPAPVRPAATILMVRETPDFEVLMVKRHHQIDFAAGALVFPGGKTHQGDHDQAWEFRTLGWGASLPDQQALRIAAIREAYEETGILLCRHPDGSPFAGDARAAQARDDVAADRRSFLSLVEALDVHLDLGALTLFARWITPAMMPKRFDTWFYLAVAPADQLALCDGWETVDAEWIAPAKALKLGAAGERKIIFPTRMNLQLLAEATGVDDAVSLARARRLVTVEPQVTPGPDGPVLVIPADAGYGAVRERLSAVD
jgi:8-oxo-dGTP pyrophosphatase MutT (NUDIX family)